MFYLLLPLLLVVFVFRIWRWKQEVDSTIHELQARLRVLERRPQPAATDTQAPHPRVPLIPSSVDGAGTVAAPRAAVPAAQRPGEPPRPAVPLSLPPTAPPPVAATPPIIPAIAPQPITSGPAIEVDSIETRIGARWLLYIGVVALIVGISYFEKLAIDNRWVGEGARVVQGGVAGLLLVYGGRRFIRSGYSIYGQMMAGGGIAVQYVSIYAAFNFYHLIGRPAAFALLLAVTMLAAVFADRQRSQGLALMAVGGGFATPFLLPGSTDAQLALFGYDAILIAGTMYLAHRRAWPVLNVVSYALTGLTVLGWASTFYTPAKYLRTELFLTLFCAMYLYILRESERQPDGHGADLSRILWTAPVAYYLASVGVLAAHPAAMLVFLLALSLAAAFVSAGLAGAANSMVRVVLWIAVLSPLLQWSQRYAGSHWLAPGLATAAGAYLIQLVAHLEATRRADHRLNPADRALVHLMGLGTFLAADNLIDAVRTTAVPPAAALFALWQAVAAWKISARDREHALHFAALGFTLLMIAIGLQFHGAWVTMGWAAEGAAIIWLGLRERRDWLRAGGLALLAVSGVRLFVLQFAPRSLDQTIVLNAPVACSLFVIGLLYGLAWLHHLKNADGRHALEIGGALVAAQLVTLSMATAEIDAYWQSAANAGIWWAARDGPQAVVCAAIGVTIAWLGLMRRQLWMRLLGGALLVIAISVMIVFDLSFVPAGYVLLFNSRVAAGVIVIALLYLLARLYDALSERGEATRLVYAVLVLAANALMLLLLTGEGIAYWRVRDLLDATGTIEDLFAREMTLSITWAVYATALIVAGIRTQYAPIRYLAIVIFALTIGKVFLFDLPQLGEIYRVLSIIGLGITLLVTSYLYHRFRSRLSSSE